MRWCSTILSLALLVSAAADAEDFSWPMKSGGGSSWSTEGLDAEHSEGGCPEEGHNPDANEQKRLVVEWGKVSVGYTDTRESLAEPRRERWIWKDNQPLHPDRTLALRGRLLLESPDGQRRQPIDWPQGVRAIISRLPDKKYDWSRRQEMDEAAWGDFLILERGEFLVRIAPGEIHRSVGQALPFQVALSLGEKTSTRVTWKNTVPVLPQSVTMLKVPGPPAIDKTMRIINGAPSYSQNDFNPAKLVRAVNHLLPMGKEKSLHELREFLKIACDSTNQTERSDDNIDTSDKTCVFLIVRLLFESDDPKEPLPEIMTIPFAPEPDEDKKYWPLFPLHLQDDVPFFLVYAGNMGGLPDQPERHVDWAEAHGRIRSKLLRPINNPMVAAARVVVLPQTQRLYKDDPKYGRDIPYGQAWKIIEDANPKRPASGPAPPDNTWNEPDWDARIEAAAKLSIHWSDAEQRYIVK